LKPTPQKHTLREGAVCVRKEPLLKLPELAKVKGRCDLDEPVDIRKVTLWEPVLRHHRVKLIPHALEQRGLLGLLTEHGHLGAEMPDDESVHTGHAGTLDELVDFAHS
jgi:hypothetical protein